MTEAVIAPPAPAAPAAPAAAPAATPAAPAASAAPAAAPAGAPPPESLIHGSPAAAPAPGAAAPAPGPAAPAPAPASDDPFAGLLQNLPEKFHVKAGDKLDPAASLAKALEHREHLEKRLGAGDLPPRKVDEYQWNPPETMQGFELDDAKTAAFKEAALKQGITTAQFKWLMDSYVAAVPDLMQGAAKMTANQARAELQKVWTAPGDIEVGLGHSERAIQKLPADLQEATREFGTNPAFIRAMAHFGAQLREDRPPANPNPPSNDGGDIKTLEASKAYLDPKHPDHQRVSAQVQAYYQRIHGTVPI